MAASRPTWKPLPPLLRASVLFLLPALLVTGCGKSIKQYAQFGQAGTTYAAAMDGLLVATRNVEVNADSELLLNLADVGPVQEPDYVKIRDAEERTNLTIQRLRKHTRLMGDYFTQLYAVATSDAPERASTATQGLAGSLNGLGAELRGQGTLLQKPQIDAIGMITKIVVTAKIRQTLKRTLDRDNETIRKELLTQQELLTTLAARIEDNVKLGHDQQEQRVILRPLKKPGELLNDRDKQDTFAVDRFRLATAETTVQELKSASNAAKKLQDAYEELISGKVNLDGLNSLLADLDTLLAFAQAVRTLSGGK